MSVPICYMWTVESTYNDFIVLELECGVEKVVIGIFYRSPNSSQASYEELYSLITLKILIGDFKSSHINWDSIPGTRSSCNTCSKFVDVMQKNFLIQHVQSATRARGSDTPHLLDLVITDTNDIISVSLYTAERLCDGTFVIPICRSAHVSCGNKADWIRMPFGIVSGVGPGIHVLDGSLCASWRRGCFWHGF